MANKKRKKPGSRRPSRVSSGVGTRSGARGGARPRSVRAGRNLRGATSGGRPGSREEARRGCLLRLVLLFVILLATVSLIYFVFGRETGGGGASPSPSPKSSQSLHLRGSSLTLLGLAAPGLPTVVLPDATRST